MLLILFKNYSTEICSLGTLFSAEQVVKSFQKDIFFSVKSAIKKLFGK